jgi:3-hydroxymyristoyl/3-hydroxydecanoyl-(acyl carrier protein) dehydratase
MAAISEQLTSKQTDAAAVTEAVLLDDTSHDGVIERRMIVPRNLAYLEGHFTRFPLVAGIVQVKWSTSAAFELLHGSNERPHLKAVKFKDALLPDQEFTLRVALDLIARTVDFTLADSRRTFSSGRLTLDRETTA